MRWTDPGLVAELAAAQTDVCRIGGGLSWRAERFGDRVIISHSSEELPADLLDGVEAWISRTGLSIAQIYARRLVVGPGRDDKPRLLKGDPALPSVTVVQENGLKYEVDLLAGYSCGLFLDQRANRAHLRQLHARRMLNTFAYTCSFSIVAAATGAQTLSIDLAKSALERGRRNLALNNLSTDGQRFIADDVLDVLPRLARRGEKYDAIILDPPTFSRGHKGRAFQAEKDYAELLTYALAVAEPGASILLSTNCSSVDAYLLRELAMELVPRAQFLPPLSLPDIPEGEGASTVWMKVP